MDFQSWEEQEFVFLLPEWTKELLDDIGINSQNFFGSRKRFKQDIRLSVSTIKIGSLSLEDLGKDVIFTISEFLSLADLQSLSQVSKLWNVLFSFLPI